MTVTAAPSVNNHVGNGVTTVFAYGFKILQAADLKVTVNGVIVTNYTVSGVRDPTGGSITFTPAPANGAAIRIARNMAIARGTDYQFNGALPADTLNDDQDAPVMMVQQVNDVVSRALKLAETDTTVLADLPSAAARADKLLAFDSNGQPTAISSVLGTATQLALDLVSSLGASLIGFLQAGIGAVTRTVQAKLRDHISVRDFGAVGNGVTNDTAAFQAFLTRLQTVGGKGRIPAGQYLLTSTVTLDLNGVPSEGAGSRSVSIEGDGANATILVGNHSGVILDIVGDPADANDVGNQTHLVLRDFQVTKTAGTIRTGTGIRTRSITQSRFDNLFLYALNIGMTATDIVTCVFTGVKWKENNYGLNCTGQVTISTPNAMDFFGCEWYGQKNYSAYFNGGNCINFCGGVVEVTQGGVDALRWGVKVDTPGQYGAAGLTFIGVYFEANTNVADIWLNCGSFPVTLNVIGCTFNRLSNTAFVDNNILVDTNSDLNVRHSVNVKGCGFRQFGTYVQSSGRPYFRVTGTTPVLFDGGQTNFYNVIDEIPTVSDGALFAMARFTNLGVASPTISRATNILSISRSGAGTYVITFRMGGPVSGKCGIPAIDIAGGTTHVSAETATTMTVETRNSAGALTDPGYLNIVVYT